MSRLLPRLSVCLSVLPLAFLCGCAETVSPFSGKTVNASELAIELQAETRKAQAEAASKQATAKAEADTLALTAKRKQREYEAALRIIQNDAAAKVESLGIEHDQALATIAASINNINNAAEAAKLSAQAKADELAARAKVAQDKIDDQRALLDTILGVVPSIPGVGGNPLAMLALAAATGYLGRKTGKATGEQIGIAKGRDIGWTERDEHQAKIDATWEEAASRKGVA